MTIDRRSLCTWALAWPSLAFTSVFSPLFSACGRPKPEFPKRLDRLAFGSCNRQSTSQQHWTTIRATKPQLFVWLGDCIYADGMTPRKRALEYTRLTRSAEYRALSSEVRIVGTWDDHDYADNDGGAEYPWKVESQQVFLDFLDEPSSSARRTQQGIYTSYLIGQQPETIQLILLDLRYFKPAVGVDADPLGEEQWRWLEAQLQRQGPALHILGSSLQVLTDGSDKESWSSFPRARTRLLDLIRQATGPTLLLSGDRHWAEVSREELSAGRSVYELTSSGLTHFNPEEGANSRRIGEAIRATNVGVLDVVWNQVSPGLLEELRFQVLSPQTGAVLLSLPLALAP